MKHVGILIILLTLYFVTSDAQAASILTSGFENDAAEWTKTATSAEYSLNMENVKEASHSASIKYTSTSTQGIKQSNIIVTPDRSYKISGFIKSVGATKKALIRIAWYQNGNSSQIKTDDSSVLSGESDWTSTEMIVTAPSSAATAELRLLVSEGQGYFDDIRMEEYTVVTPTTIVEPTEEQLLNNVTIQPDPEVNSVYISEVFAYPDSGKSEWVELYNDGDEPVELSDWYFDDAEESGAAPKSFSLSMNPKAFIVIDLSSAMFNNDGDVVRLLDNNKNERDAIEYEDAEKNISFGRNDLANTTVCFQNPSRGSTNGNCITVTTSPTKTPTPKPSTTKTPMPTPSIKKTTPTGMLPSPTERALKRYNSSGLILKKNDPSKPAVLGVNQVQKKHTHQGNPLSFLALSYSVLSLVSISVKMIIT